MNQTSSQNWINALSPDVRESVGMAASHVPSVAVTQILAYLTWRDKLNTICAIRDWKPHLHTVQAWPDVSYEHENEENIYFVRERRTMLRLCIKQYGQYMRRIRLVFALKIGRHGIQILHEIAENCKLLTEIMISQDLRIAWEQRWAWGSSSINAICCILRQCPQLKVVAINNVFIDWSERDQNNIIQGLVNNALENKVTELQLSSISLLEHVGYLDIIGKFENLRVLAIRRDKTNREMLLHLVSHQLTELKLFQDEELSEAESQQLDATFWKQVVRLCPRFKVDLVLRYIIVIKEVFHDYMPLRSLVLDDLASIVTKGVLDHIVSNYCESLEGFTYTNSFLESFETGDRRLPLALYDMVKRCQKLRSLQYGFPLSSTTILLIANARKLSTFNVPMVEVSYEIDWSIQEDWTPEFVTYLKQSGRSQQHLEEAVSRALGFDWILCYSRRMLETSVDHFHL